MVRWFGGSVVRVDSGLFGLVPDRKFNAVSKI